MKIAIGCDHGGFELKVEVIKWLKDAGHEVIDVGCPSTDRADYPVYGEKVGRTVASGEADRGIVICTSGVGISIAANKVGGIRCGLVTDPFTCEMARRHNDINVLAMGAKMVGVNMAQRIVEVFLTQETEAVDGSRHAGRVAILDAIKA